MKQHAYFRRLMLILLALACLLPLRSRAQADEIQQLLLNVEKLNQLKNILSDMKQGYDILHQGYGAVRDISQGSFRLHETFLDGLLAVNPHLQQYRRVADILAAQQQLVREYQRAYRLFREAGSFSAAELQYLGAVYSRLLEESTRHLDELALVLTAGALRMSDGERLRAIDRIYAGTADKLAFLRDFNRQTTLLALQRGQAQRELNGLLELYKP